MIPRRERWALRRGPTTSNQLKFARRDSGRPIYHDFVLHQEESAGVAIFILFFSISLFFALSYFYLILSTRRRFIPGRSNAYSSSSMIPYTPLLTRHALRFTPISSFILPRFLSSSRNYLLCFTYLTLIHTSLAPPLPLPPTSELAACSIFSC